MGADASWRPELQRCVRLKACASPGARFISGMLERSFSCFVHRRPDGGAQESPAVVPFWAVGFMSGTAGVVGSSRRRPLPDPRKRPRASAIPRTAPPVRPHHSVFEARSAQTPTMARSCGGGRTHRNRARRDPSPSEAIPRLEAGISAAAPRGLFPSLCDPQAAGRFPPGRRSPGPWVAEGRNGPQMCAERVGTLAVFCYGE